MAPFQVQVPHGVLPGQSLQVQLGDQIMVVLVPPGAQPGTILNLEVDAAVGVQPLAAGAQPPPPPPQPPQPPQGSGIEKVAVVVATIFGFFGVIAALFMLSELNLGGEGVAVAVICLIATLCIGFKLHKIFKGRGLQQPLTPTEDGAMAAVVTLPHAAIFALTIQIWSSFMTYTAADGGTVVMSGTLAALGFGLTIHLLLVLVQAKVLRGLGSRFPALAAKSPRGGYITWFSLTAVPLVLLMIGLVTWTALTCNYVANCDVNVSCEYDAACRENTSRFALIAGTGALILSIWLSRESNRGWFAVWCLVAVSTILVIWSAVWSKAAGTHDGETAVDRLSPLLIFPLLAIWVAGSAFTSSQYVQWSEATATTLSLSILASQIIFAATNVHLGLVSSSDSHEMFFTDTTTVLWLTQFIFLPVVLADRASFPLVSLAIGAGLVRTSYTLVTVPVAAMVGLVVMKLTPPPPQQLTISEIPISGFAELQQLPDIPVINGEPPTPNHNRSVACACMPLALAFGYVISSWVTAIRAEDDLDARLSATVVLAPALLASGQLHMHKLSPVLSKAAIFVSFVGTAGAWTDTTLSVIFSCIWVPWLVAAQSNARHIDAEVWNGPGPPHWGWSNREFVHALCSATIFCFLAFHRLSLHWSQPWLYIVGLYVTCWDPLSYTNHRIQGYALVWHQMLFPADNARQVHRLVPRSRLWRPGLCGPLACIVPAAFWTVRDLNIANFCRISELNQPDLCVDTGLYQLFLLLPVCLTLVEWALDEICISRHQLTSNCAVSLVSWQQAARTSCLSQIAASVLPFRVLLFISDHATSDYFEKQFVVASFHADNDTAWSGTYNFPSSAYALNTSGSNVAGVYFTSIVAAALIVNTILCAALHSKLSVFVARTPRLEAGEGGPDDIAAATSSVSAGDNGTNRRSNGEADDGYVTALAYVSGVPPTQGMSFALLAIAILDYYTPLLLAPLCMAACYASYTSYMLQQREGMWPTGLLVAVAVWVIKAGVGAFDSTEKARLGVHIFGKNLGTSLDEFISDWDAVWPPMMGSFLLLWGAFVRLKIVQKWPQQTVGSEFSWQRLFYCVDSVVFYVAVLLWSEVSNGWMCLILSVAAVGWSFIVRDATLILRVPVLFVVGSLLFEHENEMAFGEMAFFASSVGCIVVALATAGLYTSESSGLAPVPMLSPTLTEPAVLVDITLLWGLIIAFLDGSTGVTKGGLAFSLSILLLPGLHLRGYPLLLITMPFVIPGSFLYFLFCLVEANVIESGDTRPEFLGAIAGVVVALVLLVLSLAQIAPVAAGGALDFRSEYGRTMTISSYHQLLFWASLTSIYIWVIVGLYVTEYSVPTSLICAISVGLLNLILGLQRDGLLLRMSGLIELCVAIWLGATAPGVQGFAQAVLVLIGSFFALGSAGMYFYWMKNDPGDQIRPGSQATVSISNETAPEGLELMPQPQPEPADGHEDGRGASLHGTEHPSRVPVAVNAVERVSSLTTIDTAMLASSELGLSGGSDALFDALMGASGMRREQFTPGQALTLSVRLASAARSLLRETAVAPQLYNVDAERLKVRVAASDDAFVLRMVGRGTTISVISSHKDLVKDQEWFELSGIADAVGGDQLVSGGGWVLARTARGISHVSPVPKRVGEP